MRKDKIQWLILTGVPFQNSGGGQRAAQIAKTLLKCNHKINYVYAINYKEKGNVLIDNQNANLITSHVSKFSIFDFIKSIEKNTKLVILIEVPHPNFLPIIKSLKRYSIKTIYDLIDPWNTELGKGWYNRKIENEILKYADILTATTISLKQELEQRTNHIVYLIPNAYDDDLFNTNNKYERPMDLPLDPIVGYVGALWGSWFDIDLVIQLANKCPDYNIVLIGEYENQFDSIAPSNVYFLGLKPQNQLPAYLSYFKVGLIPFKVNMLTDGVNPLKVYEYLAMELPVVSTPLVELKDMPNVFLADNNKNYIRLVNEVINGKNTIEDISTWLEQNTWKSKVNKLLDIIKI